jgi:antirestriction protein ArdC
MRRTRPTSARPDVAQTITDLILVKIEQGTAPWLKPWSARPARGRCATTVHPLFRDQHLLPLGGRR